MKNHMERNMYDIIRKKRDGEVLGEEEIAWFTEGFTRGVIPDYQAAALLMAIYFKGMTEEETAALTLSMARSGDVLDLSCIPGIKVDKHSTGGVGDKTTLVLAPLVSACGVPVAKMSGRGLGYTGGTIDKLESIPGFRTLLTEEEFIRNVKEIGIAVMEPTGQLAPADKKLYALRDVTATVDQLSLIAASIMSKKLAAGADAILLDVKTGSGAFMKKPEDAALLAQEMIRIGRHAGRKVEAVISDMDQPLGRAVGNALEVKEAMETLQGKGSEDLTELCLELGAKMVLLGGKADSAAGADQLVREALLSGDAFEKFRQFVKRQGGDLSCLEDPARLIHADIQRPILSQKEGYLTNMNCEEIGMAAVLSGAGRRKKEDGIDFSAGFYLLAKKGAYVKEGEPLAVLYANDTQKADLAEERFRNACRIEPTLQK